MLAQCFKVLSASSRASDHRDRNDELVSIDALHYPEFLGIIGQIFVARLGHHDEIFETDPAGSLFVQSGFDCDDVAGP